MSFRLARFLVLAAAPLALQAQKPTARPAGTAAAPHASGLKRDPAIAALMGDVSSSRLRRIDSTLAAFGTRHAMSDTVSSTRGVGAARRWIHAQLDSMAAACGGCIRVEDDAAMIQVARHPQKPMVNIVNVLAWLPGRDTSRVVVIGGHYDTCVCNKDRWDVTTDSPGADDDGSGSAAMLELVRAFTKRHPKGLEATVLFALYGGEEEGLLGSTHLAERLHSSGYRIVAGMTNDMIGNVTADDGSRDAHTVRIYSDDPDNGPGRELARYVWGLGEVYQPALTVLPVFRLDRIGRGGDHAPFARQHDAALRFSEKLENYKRQHLPQDVLADVDFDYVAKIARLDAVTVASLAMAPAVPDSATAKRDQASGGQKWQLSWKPVPGAARYEVLVRATTSPSWQKVINVGAATTYLLDDQLDDVWAGVRAVDAAGHRSLAAVVPAPSFVTR